MANVRIASSQVPRIMIVLEQRIFFWYTPPYVQRSVPLRLSVFVQNERFFSGNHESLPGSEESNF